MSYAEGFTDLASATVRLLAAGPPGPGDELPGGQVAATLAARDIVVGGLRALTGALLEVGPVSGADLRPAHVVADPAHVLADALRALPAAAPEGVAPSEAIGAAAGDWAAAGRAAAWLEPYLGQARDLPGAAAWAALRDVADVVAALPDLDADLAARLPAGHNAARAALTEAVGHRLVGVTADQLRVQLAGMGEDRAHLDRFDAPPAAPMLLRSAADLPAGMARIAAVLDDIGGELAAVDARAVARLLATGVDLTARTAAGTGWDGLAAALAPVLTGLRQTVTADAATLSRPDMRLRVLTTEVAGQLRRLAERPAPDAAAPAVAWVRQVPAVTTALTRAACATGGQRRLLGRPGEEVRGRSRFLLWVPVAPEGVDRHPLVVGLRATGQALHVARDVLGPSGAPRPEVAGVVAAAVELRDAVRARRSQPASRPRAAPSLPAHPAQRVYPGTPGPRPGR